MSEPERRRGRVHDAEGAREAILNAAEEVFAEHGFDGARIDAIAETAGYNKSLIFQYFEDKVWLYTTVVMRLAAQGNQQLAKILGDAPPGEEIVHDAEKFRTFLEIGIGMTFDFLLEHPSLLRILTWEAAEGWETFTSIMAHADRALDTSGIEYIMRLISEAQAAGIVRPGLDPMMLLIIVTGISQFYLTSIPRYQALLPGRDLSSREALEHAREQIIRFVIHGMMVDSGEAKP